MGEKEIIAALAAAGGIFFTQAFTAAFKSVDYNFAYQKEIFTKRIKVYEQIETALMPVFKSELIEPGVFVSAPLLSSDSLTDFFNGVFELRGSYSWITNETINKIERFNKEILELHRFIYISEDEEYRKERKVHYSEPIRDEAREIIASAFKDTHDLHRVDLFMQEKGIGTVYFWVRFWRYICRTDVTHFLSRKHDRGHKGHQNND